MLNIIKIKQIKLLVYLQPLAPEYIQNGLSYHGAEHARTDHHSVHQRNRVKVPKTLFILITRV
jgi:hypothetical protein